MERERERKNVSSITRSIKINIKWQFMWLSFSFHLWWLFTLEIGNPELLVLFVIAVNSRYLYTLPLKMMLKPLFGLSTWILREAIACMHAYFGHLAKHCYKLRNASNPDTMLSCIYQMSSFSTYFAVRKGLPRASRAMELARLLQFVHMFNRWVASNLFRIKAIFSTNVDICTTRSKCAQ